MSWQDPSTDLENVNAAYVIERDDNARLRAEIERLREVIAEAPDWGEQYLREMDERKRQGDRAHKWKTRAEAAALQLRYAIDALEGSPWTGWSTGDARDFLMHPESPPASDEIQDGGS